MLKTKMITFQKHGKYQYFWHYANFEICISYNDRLKQNYKVREIFYKKDQLKWCFGFRVMIKTNL